MICASGLRSLWELLVGLQGPAFQQNLILPSGLRLQTVDAVTRISAMNASAAQAGVLIGDALWSIGGAHVLGVNAHQIGQFFVGPLGVNGELMQCKQREVCFDADYRVQWMSLLSGASRQGWTSMLGRARPLNTLLSCRS